MKPETNLNSIGDFIAKIGFPISVAIFLIAGVMWLMYNQITNTDHLIRDDTAAKIEMTSAIRSLKETNQQLGSSLKSLEMEVTGRLDKIEMKIEK